MSGRVETWEETDEEARVVQYKISGIGGRGGERERERERDGRGQTGVGAE